MTSGGRRRRRGGDRGSPRPPRDARALAATVLSRVDEGARSNDALRDALPALSDRRDRALATELTYGVLRWRRRLDHALAPHVRRGGLDRIEPIARTLLELGAYQILMLDRIPAPIAVSATQEAARALRCGRITGLLNAVLRRVTEHGERLPEGQSDRAIAIRTSLPEWIVAALRKSLPPDPSLEAEALALRQRPAVTLRPTASRGGVEAAAAALAAEDIRATVRPDGLLEIAGAGDPFETRAFTSGLFVAQDPASFAVVDALGASPGDRVLDLCAGRCVKATALADRGVDVVAVDIDGGKLDAGRALAERLGVAERMTFRSGDARTLDLGEPFSHVIVDAPCTGLGTLRRHPEIAWRRSPSDVHSLVALQGQLLDAGARALAPGGRLLYAVCSFVRAEGEPAAPPSVRPIVDVHRTMPSDGSDAFQHIVYSKGG